MKIKELGGDMIEILGVVYVKKSECDRHARAEFSRGLEKGTTIHRVEPMDIKPRVLYK